MSISQRKSLHFGYLWIYKKFPGNPTRSYRSQAPLKIVGEVTDWVRLTAEELQQWRERIANLKADSNAKIIN